MNKEEDSKSLTKRQLEIQQNKINKSKRHVYEDISQITDNIFIGNKEIAKDVKQLKKYGITHIVNCANELKYLIKYHKNVFEYLWLPLVDSYIENINEYFSKTNQFIDDAITKGGKVLIHCSAGISRSSSVTIAYLMYKENITFDNALKKVKNERSYCKPNDGFVEQLKEYNN